MALIVVWMGQGLTWQLPAALEGSQALMYAPQSLQVLV
jgi:hypothetical protein